MVRPLLPVLLLTFLLPAVAVAEEVEVLEDLVVTATGEYDAGLAAVGTLTGGADFANLLALVANAQAGSSPGPVFALRGLTQEGTATLGTRSNPSLGVSSAGMPRSTNTLWVLGSPTWDMRELDVRRGPALFGSGPVAQGGELLLEPFAPVFRHEGRLLTKMGEFGFYRMGFTENLVLMPDVLALRLNFATDGTDGAVTNVTLDDEEFAAVERRLFRGQLRWRPAGNERSVVDMLVETEAVNGNPLGLAATLPGGDFFDREAALNTRESVPVDRHAAILRTRTDLEGGRRFEGEVAWQELDGHQFADFDGTPALDWFYRVGVREQRLTGGSRWHQDGEDAGWTLGLYAESSDYRFDFRGTGFAPLPWGSPFASRVEESVNQLAGFAHGEREMFRQLWLMGGVRLDHQEREQRTAFVFNGATLGADRTKVRSTEWLPELGIEWRADTAKAGFKVSRSYRPAAAAYHATLGASEPYGAERGWEANLYADKRWQNVTFGVRGFYAKLSGQQVPYVATGGFPILDQSIGNAGAATRAGVEVEWEWQGPGAFVARCFGGYLHTEYDRLVLNGIDRSGQELPFSPELQVGLQLGWSPVEGWFAESAFTWSDTSYSQAASPGETGLEKRLLLSARIGYRWKYAEGYVFGTNLLNQDYALVRQDYRGIGRGIEGAPAMPRVIGAGLSWQW